jgi:radical SAM superfamily enzyme YgiQ (UPF0313 family)
MANCIILNGGTEEPIEQRGVVHKTLGAYRIASALEDHGYSTFIVDHISTLTIDEIVTVLTPHIDKDTLWVGVSSSFIWQMNQKTSDRNTRVSDYGLETMYYHSYADMVKLFNFVKQHSSAKLIYGGARSPFYTLDNKIDYYVFGNADNAVIDLTDYLAGKVDKIQHVKEITTNGVTCVVVDSADYPEPAMDNISTHWWNKNFNILNKESLPIELARGCIFKCKFCNFHLTGKKKGTYLRDIEEVRDELLKIYEAHGTTNYWFTDDTFNDDNDKLEALHGLFTSLPFKPRFSCYLRIDLLNKYPHQAELLSDMGLMGTFFGLETLEPASAKAIGKGLHPNKVKDRLYWLNEQWKNKVNMSAGFILGLPYDNLQYFYELITWCLEKDNPLQQTAFYPLLIYHYHNQRPEWNKYSSEFSLNPEIYGYKVQPGTATLWELPSQDLKYTNCFEIANMYNDLVRPKNKVSGFDMNNLLNLGIPIDDLFQYTELEIFARHNLPALNTLRINEYKKLIGL